MKWENNSTEQEVIIYAQLILPRYTVWPVFFRIRWRSMTKKYMLNKAFDEFTSSFLFSKHYWELHIYHFKLYIEQRMSLALKK